MNQIFSHVKSDFLHHLVERGFIHQATDLDGLDHILTQQMTTAYIGFDATADSLHIGSLVPIMMLRWLQRTGHRPIVLMGGGTTKVGDPSGKDETRKLLTDDQIAANISGIQKIFAQYLYFADNSSEKNATILANNASWLDSLAYIPFLRDVGKHFTINRMLTFDSVKTRLEREQPLTFLEFNYMILQAYDFVELYQREKCVLQMGGSDQWGNITSGVDLGRRLTGAALFGLTCPLLTTASGAKMGKTAQGAVWLNSDKLPIYDFYQYWRNTEDADVERFLKLFTELPMDEIKRLGALQGAEINEAKKILAVEATSLAHGREAALLAAETARLAFEDGAMAEGLPVITVNDAALASGIELISLLADHGLVASKGEARRLIRGGGVKIEGQTIDSEAYALKAANWSGANTIKLSLGKKKHVLIEKG
ncbi:MAG: tyrosine--tRNA ligase [Alphaproteobacteria bacterium]